MVGHACETGDAHGGSPLVGYAFIVWPHQRGPIAYVRTCFSEVIECVYAYAASYSPCAPLVRWSPNPAYASPPVPPVSDAARAAGLVDVRTVVPDAVIDLRYATPNNFVGVPMYPADARCLVHESMAPGLAAAAAVLRPTGEVARLLGLLPAT